MSNVRYQPPTQLGSSIPANEPHAVSVTLPKWKDNIDYEEGAARVTSKMELGYPRFFIHPTIQKVHRCFASVIDKLDRLTLACCLCGYSSQNGYLKSLARRMN